MSRWRPLAGAAVVVALALPTGLFRPAAAQEAAAVPSLPPAATKEATPPPLLELGFSGGGGWLPDYPAADQNHAKGIVVPFITYRGEFLRSDETGVRTRFYKTPRYELDISLDGAFPTSSDDNRAREGMPDLDLTGEIGPDLRITLDREERRSRLELELALRGFFTADLDGINYRGVVLAPELAYRRLDLLVDGSLLRVGAGPVFATGGVMDYFYDVEPRFTEQGRPEHESQGGYLGSRLQGSFAVPFTKRLSLTLGGRLDGFWGATNDDSPLFQRNYNASVAGGFAVSFYQSAKRARTGEDLLD